MKRKTIVSCAAIILVGASVVSICKMNNYSSIILENAEALSSGEDSTKGRWKTVGCDSDNFSDWRTYCCPSDYVDNCDGRVGTCPHYPSNGCQDTFEG